MKKIIIILVIAAGLLFGNNTKIFAQADSNIGDRIQKIKLEKLLNKLDLDESTSKTFVEKYKEFAKTVKAINKKRFRTYRLMAENLESGNGLDTLVDQMTSLEKELNDKKEAFTDEMKTLLTPKQFATMVIFERKFNNEILKLLRDFKNDSKKESQ